MRHNMVKAAQIAALAALALAGCSDNNYSDAAGEAAMADRSITSADIAEPALEEQAMADAASDGGSGTIPGGDIPVSLPKIAYVYSYGFRIAGDKIAPLQQKHADLCEKQGPYTCRIISMDSSGSEGSYVRGSLQLAVAANKARGFGTKLAQLAEGDGGTQVSTSIEGEDLSKEIVDTEARLRSRIALRDRLMEVLKSRNGKVSELVEAERNVAQVNEEIDRARSWLAEMKGRVEFSRVNISYESGAPSSGGFLDPIRQALGSIGGILGMIFATLIVLLTVLIPLSLLGWGVYRLVRWVRRKGAASAGATPAGEQAEAAD